MSTKTFSAEMRWITKEEKVINTNEQISSTAEQ